MCPDPKSGIYFRNGTQSCWKRGPRKPRTSSLVSQVLVFCYPGKKLDHRLQSCFGFPSGFPGGFPFIPLGRRYHSVLMFLPECFAVGLHDYSAKFS